MNNRPIEIFTKIFSYLDQASLSSVATSCRFWNLATDNDILWKNILCKELNIELSDLNTVNILNSAKNIVKNLIHLKEMISTNQLYRNINSFLNKNAKNPLIIACLDDQVDIFKKIASTRENININAWLDFSCAYGAKQLVQYFLLQPNARRPDETMLKLAVGSDNKLLIEHLLNNYSNLTINPIVFNYSNQSNNPELKIFLEEKMNEKNLLRKSHGV